MLKKSEQKTLDAAKAMDGEFTPTALGIAMGYEHAQASSRVALALKNLTASGHLVKTKTGHNSATYRVK